MAKRQPSNKNRFLNGLKHQKKDGSESNRNITDYYLQSVATAHRRV
nr:MAG TPA: hypothetical protein [Caudoviricetes sp.]